MKTAEIKELSVADLVERIEAEKANLTKMKVTHSVSPIENSTNIRKSRRDIARMLTVLRQKNNK
ncbi:MAG: 50S ribosomal protein L29 [Tidjanibacter sp.]|nr:50S ribosomal protein L29 [Tidjanibacter sp.]MBR4064558.1 50S ribosomal protein L29 [Tidjanibacter sp.]